MNGIIIGRKSYKAIKRACDISLSSVLLVASVPLMAGISLAIKRESPGSVIFSHERMGRGGRTFRMYKFRSMTPGSDDLEASLNDKDLEAYYQEYKLRDDPRVTETGRYIRKTSLDELPQLLNVIKGDMSLVGPRPVMASELEFYTDDERSKLLSVRPGITGYWQVRGRHRATYQSRERQAMELYYVDHASALLDLGILIRTPIAVLLGKDLG